MSDKVITAELEASAIVPEVWSGKFFDVALPALPFNGSVSRDYEGEIQDMGDTVNISTVPEFDEAIDLAESARNDADAVTISQQQLVINHRLVKDFIVTKRAQLQSLPMMDKLRDHAVFAILKKMHSIILGDIAPSTAAPDHDASFDSGTTLALIDIVNGKKALDAADCPSMGRKMNCGTSQFNDLFLISGFTSRDYIPQGSPLPSGEIATPVLGFEVDMSSELGDTAYLFHPSFMTMAIQEDLDVRAYDLGVEGKRAARVNTDLLFGVKQLDNTRVYKLS